MQQNILLEQIYVAVLQTQAEMLKLGIEISNIKKQLKNMARTLDEVLQDVTDESTQIDSLTALFTGIKQQLADALAGLVTPEMQAKIDAVFEGVEANKQKVITAINAQ